MDDSTFESENRQCLSALSIASVTFSEECAPTLCLVTANSVVKSHLAECDKQSDIILIFFSYSCDLYLVVQRFQRPSV